MKNLLKSSIKAFLLVCLLSVTGQSFGAKPVPGARIPELDDLDFTEMLMSVDVGKYSDIVQKEQQTKGKKLTDKFNDKNGSAVETFRNKEVLLVTIPAKLLFDPNETLLNAKADDYLEPFKAYMKSPDEYRVLLVMHTDNTGSETYREEIAGERVESVFEWFEQQSGLDTSYVFTYNFADEMPLVENDTQQNRDKNRRLEVYLMPGQKWIDRLKKEKK